MGTAIFLKLALFFGILNVKVGILLTYGTHLFDTHIWEVSVYKTKINYTIYVAFIRVLMVSMLFLSVRFVMAFVSILLFTVTLRITISTISL